MNARIDLTGQVFGELTVQHHSEGRKWFCKCSCGAITAVAADKLRSGHTISCGHKRIEALRARSTSHGHAKRGKASPEYRVWCGIVDRCKNPANAAWAKYGGRGITLCKRWGNFGKFFVDMGPRPEGTSIDRIDNNKGYTPSNCRWATRAEQARNTSRSRNIRFKRDTMCVADWAAKFGITPSSVYYWLGRYGDVEAIRKLHEKYIDV